MLKYDSGALLSSKALISLKSITSPVAMNSAIRKSFCVSASPVKAMKKES